MVIIQNVICPSVRDPEGNLATSVTVTELGFDNEAPGHSDSWQEKHANLEHTR